MVQAVPVRVVAVPVSVEAVPVRVVGVPTGAQRGLNVTVKSVVPTVPTVPITTFGGMTTRSAFTMPGPARLPVTSTLSPTTTSDKPAGGVMPGATNFVDVNTLMVKSVAVPVRVVDVLVRGTGVIGPKPRVIVKPV